MTAALEQPSDAQAVRASYDDPDAFVALFTRHAGDIRRYAARRLGADVAEDLTAETFLIAFRSRRAFDTSRESARPWLYGIVSRLIDKHRRQEARGLRALARSGRDPVAATWSDQVDARVDAGSHQRALAAALADLTPGDRRVLLLYAWADLGYAEIAEALSIPVGTVRSRLHRARKRVRAGLVGVAGITIEEDEDRG